MARAALNVSWLALFLMPFVLACALASPIQPATTSQSSFWFFWWGEPELTVSEVPEGEQFRIYHRGSTGFTPVSALRQSAEARGA